ncbi:MAG: radical SAM protein [Bacteroidales bacterium]|nr:radical SAM protein [Bacteroidales bacterium]
MKTKHFNIPIFIPEISCPFQCIYCNQYKITGRTNIPDEDEINNIIISHLQTLPLVNTRIEIAFFGGSFTGLPVQKQEKLLKIIHPYIHEGKVSGIRLSTRPDYITPKILEMLNKNHVTCIELGAQSMVNEVLQKSGRGHTSEQTEKSAKLIKEYGFELGLQMMIGLPGDSLENAVYTANKIAGLNADNTRIYPLLVIKGTKLHEMYKKGLYVPMSLEQAVDWSKHLLLMFEKANVRVIKMGLHPSEGLVSGEDLVAGPFSPSFRELVLSDIWKDKLNPLLSQAGDYCGIEILVPVGQLNSAVGYNRSNKKMFQAVFKNVLFKEDKNLEGRNFNFNFTKC